MPIWPVSFVDGIYQVADADGAHYPLTMQGNSVSEFNAGWTPRGLQTGLAPFHVLELYHDTGVSTFWLLDSGLDFRSNAVVHLRADDRVLFFAHIEPLVRTLFDESVKAPHSAIPAAAHEFDEFLPSSVYDLTVEAVDRVLGRPDIVSTAALDEIGGYGRNGVTLSASWITHALRPVAAAQETLDLQGYNAVRYFDASLGVVYYVLEDTAAPARHLYVPAASVMFSANPASLDSLVVLTRIIVWYATHTDRVVMLPEANMLQPELLHVTPPPQHGLDEPVDAAAPTPEYRGDVAHQLAEPLPPAHRNGSDRGPDVRTEPPVTASAPGRADEPVRYRNTAPYPIPEPLDPTIPSPDIEPAPATVIEPERYYHDEAPATGNGAAPQRPESRPESPPVPAEPLRPAPARLAPASVPRQNWWQRLLGLGNG